jgi:hemolysin-activating ACP:hemolysin acyltransferase
MRFSMFSLFKPPSGSAPPGEAASPAPEAGEIPPQLDATALTLSDPTGAGDTASAGTGPAAATPSLSEAEAKRRAGQAKRAAAAFGEIVILVARSANDRSIAVKDLEWLVMPGIALGQFAVAEAQSRDTGVVVPAGAVLWAFVSEAVDARLCANLDQPIRLEPGDWRSGGIPWVVLAVGDGRVVGALLQQTSKTVFRGTAPKMRVRQSDGTVMVAQLDLGGGSANP